MFIWIFSCSHCAESIVQHIVWTLKYVPTQNCYLVVLGGDQWKERRGVFFNDFCTMGAVANPEADYVHEHGALVVSHHSCDRNLCWTCTFTHKDRRCLIPVACGISFYTEHDCCLTLWRIRRLQHRSAVQIFLAPITAVRDAAHISMATVKIALSVCLYVGLFNKLRTAEWISTKFDTTMFYWNMSILSNFGENLTVITDTFHIPTCVFALGFDWG
jgi:hypothetical protein